MKRTVRDRWLYLRFRVLALLIQAGAVVCLLPIGMDHGYGPRIIAFLALSLMAWFLNVYSRRTSEYERRTLARRPTVQHREEVAFLTLTAAFGLMAVVYIQFLPTWPIFATALLLGGCAGYAATTA